MAPGEIFIFHFFFFFSFRNPSGLAGRLDTEFDGLQQLNNVAGPSQ
jgi:hypothetical protein